MKRLLLAAALLVDLHLTDTLLACRQLASSAIAVHSARCQGARSCYGSTTSNGVLNHCDTCGDSFWIMLMLPVLLATVQMADG